MRGGQARTAYDVLRVPDVRRIELGWGASVIGELAGQVTLVVYAFAAGGAVLVAVYIASRTLVSMVVTLGIGGVSGRLRPGVLLRRVTWLRAVLLALGALTAALHGAPAAVIALAAASSSLAGTYRPLQVTILPWLVGTPAELASSNAVAAILENAGALAGPLLAGGLLLLAGPPVPVALAAGFLGLAALSLTRLTVPDVPGPAVSGAVQVARDAACGLAELARVAPRRARAARAGCSARPSSRPRPGPAPDLSRRPRCYTPWASAGRWPCSAVAWPSWPWPTPGASCGWTRRCPPPARRRNCSGGRPCSRRFRWP